MNNHDRNLKGRLVGIRVTGARANPIFGALSCKIVVMPTIYFESYYSCAHPIFDTFLRGKGIEN